MIKEEKCLCNGRISNKESTHSLGMCNSNLPINQEIKHPCCKKCEIYLDYKNSYQCNNNECNCHMTNQEEREDKLTCQIIDILKYQQVITNQGIFYMGEKDWALNKIKNLIQSEINLALSNRNKEIVEKIREYAEPYDGAKWLNEVNAQKIINLITKDNE